MRKPLTIAALLFICLNTYGQQVNGFVTDKQTGRFISGAFIKSAAAIVLSDLHGQFTIKVNQPNDTLHVTMRGYEPHQQTVNEADKTIIIALSQTTQLREVTVTAQKDRVADSIATRKMFAKSFNSRAPKFGDIVQVDVAPGPVPVAGVTIIPSQLVRAITYKYSREYQFQKTLLQDENDKYIDARFNKSLVTQLTKLEEDSLTLFMYKYRPTIVAIKKMTSYDLRTYIKKSLVDFKRAR